MHKPGEIAAKLLGLPFDRPDATTLRVAQHIASRKHISRNVEKDFGTSPARGQRAADAVASLGGSWTVVGLFAATMLAWVGLTAILMLNRGSSFDPYSYIPLSLFLSMLAAIEAPTILMPQDRQSEKDRVSAEHHYEVNLKA